MIKTVVVPKNNLLQLSIPNSYVRKEIEVFLYAKDELVEEGNFAMKSLARFRGLLSSTEADQLQTYVEKSKEECDQNT